MTFFQVSFVKSNECLAKKSTEIDSGSAESILSLPTGSPGRYLKFILRELKDFLATLRSDPN